jgi:DNA-binding Lrp family transcriptional regulator
VQEPIGSAAGMQDSPALDETDLAIVHALQISPQASWTLVGSVLEISPVTASRRWERLVEAGLAWVSCIPGPALWSEHVVAFVELRCEAAAVASVVGTLACDPRVASIEVVASEYDLVLTMFVADLSRLSGFVLDEVGHLPGVVAVRTHLGTGVYAQGAGWRLDALDPDQQAQIQQSVPGPLASAPTPREHDRELLLACIGNGRRSAVELAELLGSSPTTVRRRLDRLVRGGLASFRCEVANRIAGWPISATFWANVPPEALTETARAIATLAQVRLCAAVTGGKSNMVVTVWLRSLGDSQRLEHLLSSRVPGLTIHDRAIALRIPKRVGWMLDEAGRAQSVVPIDPWYEARLALEREQRGSVQADPP